MEREILAYIKQNRMIGKNDVVLAGVSGGSDSMAMLRILKELQGKLDFTLRVVHIHHGIRGKEADRDQSFVENICRKWQIPCTVYCYDVPGLSREWKLGEEETGICAVDLYTGICNFLKAGAASTFIKRDHWVESITSESLAAGLVQQIDFETATRKLYHGDYLIMMTDGVLDALPDQKEEETMKEIIMDVHEESPKDFGRGILERVLGYSDYHARDDMTVLVAGVWKK